MPVSRQPGRARNPPPAGVAGALPGECVSWAPAATSIGFRSGFEEKALSYFQLNHMKKNLFLALWWVAAFNAAGQIIETKSIVTRTIPITKQTRLNREMMRFLLSTHEADKAAVERAMFQVPLLVNAGQRGIGIYKFGITSAHADYKVVFQYRHQLVFSSALSLAPLLANFRHFLGQYPNAFDMQAQQAAKSQLRDIVEYNQNAGESELPSREN